MDFHSALLTAEQPASTVPPPTFPAGLTLPALPTFLPRHVPAVPGVQLHHAPWPYMPRPLWGTVLPSRSAEDGDLSYAAEAHCCRYRHRHYGMSLAVNQADGFDSRSYCEGESLSAVEGGSSCDADVRWRHSSRIFPTLCAQGVAEAPLPLQAPGQPQSRSPCRRSRSLPSEADILDFWAAAAAAVAAGDTHQKIEHTASVVHVGSALSCDVEEATTSDEGYNTYTRRAVRAEKHAAVAPSQNEENAVVRTQVFRRTMSLPTDNDVERNGSPIMCSCPACKALRDNVAFSEAFHSNPLDTAVAPPHLSLIATLCDTGSESSSRGSSLESKYATPEARQGGPGFTCSLRPFSASAKNGHNFASQALGFPGSAPAAIEFEKTLLCRS